VAKGIEKGFDIRFIALTIPVNVHGLQLQILRINLIPEHHIINPINVTHINNTVAINVNATVQGFLQGTGIQAIHNTVTVNIRSS